MSAPPTRARVRRIRDRLRELYGRPYAPPHGQGLDELILTVLPQSTNDRNRDVAFLGLRLCFHSWSAVRDAPNAEVELAIRPGGISKVKSLRIEAILRQLRPSAEHRPPRARERRDEADALEGAATHTIRHAAATPRRNAVTDNGALSWEPGARPRPPAIIDVFHSAIRRRTLPDRRESFAMGGI